MAIAQAITLTFEDGTEQVVRRRPIDLVRAERLLNLQASESGLQPGSQEVVLTQLWATVSGGDGTVDDRDAWIATLDNWEFQVNAPEVDADPPAQGSAGSPD